GAAVVFSLLHSGALARAIVEIAALRDDAVEHSSDVLEPRLGFTQPPRGRRETNSFLAPEISTCEGLQLAATLVQRQMRQRSAVGISQQIEHDQQCRCLCR